MNLRHKFAPDWLQIQPVQFGDSGSVDSFGRARVSTPVPVFDGQFTYTLLSPLFEQLTSGAGATIAHDTTNRCALFTLAATPVNGYAFMQTFEYFRYQPGRSQLIFMTFNFEADDANSTKFIGYGEGPTGNTTNGIQLERTGTTTSIAIYSSTTNGNQSVAQTAWNVDKMDGTGPSGVTIDWTKSQILVIDLQALYIGRVRVGFDIGGVLYYVHEFLHANLITTSYLASANLPLRAGIQALGTSSTTMRFFCSSVTSEGGIPDPSGFEFTQELQGTAGNGVSGVIGSLQPRLTFNTFQARAKFILEEIEIFVTGNSAVRWDLCIGVGLTGAVFSDVNTTYSTFQYSSTNGTVATGPAIVIHSGYCISTAATKDAISKDISVRYPITLDAAGAVRVLGRLTLLATGLSAASAMRAVLSWRELR